MNNWIFITAVKCRY